MKHFIYILSFLAVTTFFSSCTQTEVEGFEEAETLIQTKAHQGFNEGEEEDETISHARFEDSDQGDLIDVDEITDDDDEDDEDEDDNGKASK